MKAAAACRLPSRRCLRRRHRSISTRNHAVRRHTGQQRWVGTHTQAGAAALHRRCRGIPHLSCSSTTASGDSLRGEHRSHKPASGKANWEEGSAPTPPQRPPRVWAARRRRRPVLRRVPADAHDAPRRRRQRPPRPPAATLGLRVRTLVGAAAARRQLAAPKRPASQARRRRRARCAVLARANGSDGACVPARGRPVNVWARGGDRLPPRQVEVEHGLLA